MPAVSTDYRSVGMVVKAAACHRDGRTLMAFLQANA
jgi:hypothetical protein